MEMWLSGNVNPKLFVCNDEELNQLNAHLNNG